MSSQPTIARIQKVTARHFGVSIAELKSPRRSRMIARPRQLAMTLARDHTRHSLPEIGRRFGGRDHTTVLHAIRKIAELTETDALVKADYEVLQAEILEGVETTGSLESLAKLLAPVIADEINLNFVLQIEKAKAKACKKTKVVMVTNELEPELLQAITCATQNFTAYENACGTFGEKLRLERFIESFSHLRSIHREFESTQTPKGSNT